STGTPYCSDSDVRVPIVSISPPIVLPSLAMVMKSSPGLPSSKSPTVMYPSCPPTENLWVREWRVAGGRRRNGAGPGGGGGARGAASGSSSFFLRSDSFVVARGWLLFDPSR